MSPECLEELALRFALASRLASYPAAEHARAVAELADGAGGPEGWLAPHLAAADLDDVRGEYLALFDHGPDRTSLYETEHGRMSGMSKGNVLADLAGFYLAFGLARVDGDMADHVAVELEFYAVLLARQARLAASGDAEGREIVEDARRKFLADHLGRFVPAIAARVAGSEAYGPAFAWAARLVDEECRALGATPAPLDPFAAADDDDADDGCCPAPARLPQVPS